MPDSEHAIVIAAAAEDCPDGRTLTPRQTTREPNGTLWFGADLEREGDQLWFRIDEQAIGTEHTTSVSSSATLCAVSELVPTRAVPVDHQTGVGPVGPGARSLKRPD